MGLHGFYRDSFTFLKIQFFITNVLKKELPAALGPGVDSASNRNEYQKRKNNNVSGE
jgi:hypothetical protein